MTEPRQHRADARIVSLIGGAAPPTEADFFLVIGRIAEAPFLSRESLEKHVQRRIADEQWPGGTTPSRYMRDLRAICRAAHNVVLYERRGGYLAGAISKVEEAMPGMEHARGRLAFVVYAVDRGTLITGYPVDSTTDLAIPRNALWLTRPS